MAVLQIGSRGDDVRRVQKALNDDEGLHLIPKLVLDGQFGQATHRAVLLFQHWRWLVEDGKVGPRTEDALAIQETYPPILHQRPRVAQTTPTTCWAAATAMLTRSNVAAVIKKTPPELIDPKTGALLNFSGAGAHVGDENPYATSERYAKVHGLRLVAMAQSLSVAGLRTLMTRGPLMFDMLWKPEQYAAGFACNGHMVVVTGMRGDDDPEAFGTVLRIQDPWPSHKGSQYLVNYREWLDDVSTRSYRVFQ